MRDAEGTTALSEASYSGHVEVVRLLLEAAAVDKFNSRQCVAALTWACYNGHTAVASLLLQATATDAAVDDGITALMWASSSGHVAVVSLLLEAGAAVDVTDKAGKTALMWAPYDC